MAGGGTAGGPPLWGSSVMRWQDIKGISTYHEKLSSMDYDEKTWTCVHSIPALHDTPHTAEYKDNNVVGGLQADISKVLHTST